MSGGGHITSGGVVRGVAIGHTNVGYQLAPLVPDELLFEKLGQVLKCLRTTGADSTAIAVPLLGDTLGHHSAASFTLPLQKKEEEF